MAFKKVAIEKQKLEVGDVLEGYLVGSTYKTFNSDGETVELTALLLKDKKDGTVTKTFVGGDYFSVLKKGLLTRVSKVETKKDGETSTRVDVEQDDTDSISIFVS
jgi:hypothetical protein